jgi:hypothetical protein
VPGGRAEWEIDELIGSWTLIGADWQLVGNKTGATRLGFALILKFYEIEGRFPACPEEVPQRPQFDLRTVLTCVPVPLQVHPGGGDVLIALNSGCSNRPPVGGPSCS